MSEPVAASPPPDLARRVKALRARGAAHYDPVALDLVEGLVARAEGQEARAADRLRARAEHHLGRLEAAHAEACARAERALVAHEAAAGGRDAAALRERLEAGDAIAVLQRLRAWSGAAVAGDAAPRARARYRAALADLETTLAGDRPAPPEEHAGLLNGAELAARVLAEAERLSPAWRRSVVASLLDLAALMHLPEPPPPRRPR
jgi:hypothetical protein